MSSYFLDTLNCCKVNWNYFYQESWNSKEIICLSRSLPLSFSLSVQVEVRVRVWGLWRFRFDSSCSKVAICSQKPVWPSLFKLLPPSPSVCVCWCVLVCVCALMCVVKCRHFFMCTPWAIFPLYTSFYAPATRVEKKRRKKKTKPSFSLKLNVAEIMSDSRLMASVYTCVHI